MVQEIVSRIESSSLMPPHKPFPIPIPTLDPCLSPSDNRSRVIQELVLTERSYISSLETLQQYMKECITTKALTRDAVRAMFSNLSELLDFQRRFLISMEGTLVLPINEQRIGLLFSQHVRLFPLHFSLFFKWYFA